MAQVKTKATPEAVPARPATEVVHLFKDGGRYKGDVFVSVNGRTYQVRRGEDVEVPAEVAEVLRNSAMQASMAAARVAANAVQE